VYGVERFVISDIIHEDEAHGAAIVCCRDRSISLLSGSVLFTHHTSVRTHRYNIYAKGVEVLNVDGFDRGLTSSSSSTTSIHSRGDVHGLHILTDSVSKQVSK